MAANNISQQLIAAGVTPLDADAIVATMNRVQNMYAIHALLTTQWVNGGLHQARRDAVLDWWSNEKIPLKYKRLLTASEASSL